MLSPARELGFALSDVARLLRTYSDQRARELGTTRAQWAVLTRLQRCEGVKQNELAEALDLAPITLGRLIDKLTAAGLVERRDDAVLAIVLSGRPSTASRHGEGGWTDLSVFRLLSLAFAKPRYYKLAYGITYS